MISQYAYMSRLDYILILCDLNLLEFIHRSKQTLESVLKDMLLLLKAQQIWNIMKYITENINYLHILNLVHRFETRKRYHSFQIIIITYDLIVLYSQKHLVWKLVNFGYLSKVTLNSIYMSVGAKGSEEYRAPELLYHNVNVTLFNNEVDI